MASAASVTKVPPARALRVERVFAALVVVVPTLGLLAAFAVGRPTASDVAAFVITYLVTGFGITVGYHRLFTHRSFDAPRWVNVAFAIAGSMALQGPVIRWVADHRRHHMHSDKVGDPHSPHAARREGFWGAVSAFAHAHLGWFFASEKTRVARFAKDLLADKGIAWVDKRYLWWVFATYALPFAIGLGLTGALRGGLTALLWGGFVRVLAVHHVTWSINSVCHVFGARRYESRDLSSNVWWLAVPSLGESWHNGHHAFPTSARHGLRPLEIDPSWMLIRSMQAVGLASNVKLPTREQQMRKRLGIGAGALALSEHETDAMALDRDAEAA